MFRPSCLISAAAVLLSSATVFAQVRAATYVSGLTQPVAFAFDPSDPTREFVAQQNGIVRVIAGGALQPTPFLDVSASITSGGERGLLGLAFAPDYGSTGRFYVDFTDLGGNTVVARFKRSNNPLVADPASRFDLLWSTGLRYIAQPFANHNGGCLAFGPDGYLYIGMGDGGSANDPGDRAQNPNELLGKILRVDVNVPDGDNAGLRVPPDNPFLGGRPVLARPEIWSFGLRNPWRFSFDDPRQGGTGALIIADVGQGSWEEVDAEPRGSGGRNYGWRNREGAHDNVTSLPPAYLPLIDPIYEYDHTVGQSITGGYLVRSARMGALNGRYVFGDFVAGRVWSMVISFDAGGTASATDLREHTSELGGGPVLGNVSSFGVSGDGTLYILSYSNGTIIRVQGPPAAPSNLRIIR